MSRESACPLVWECAGKPGLAATQEKLYVAGESVCAVCGRTVDATADLGKIAGKNFTDQYWLVDLASDRCCRACGWVLTGKPPRTVRMWTVVAAPGRDLPASNPKAWIQDTPGLMLTSRGHVTPVIDILTAPPETPWVVSVALSGQKHVLPFAAVNRGGDSWSVRLETATVTANPATFTAVLVHAAYLRAAGHSADSITTLTPGRPAKTRADLDLWMLHASALAPYRGSPLLDLALWCLTKETITAYAR